MKKLLLVGAVALMGVMNAQTTFGAKAGANFSTFTGDVEDAKTLAGFHAGFFAQIPLTDKFSLQPEVLYSGQGAKSEGDGKWTADYINVPVMFKYAIAEKFNLEAGPQVGFLMSSKLKYDEEKLDVKDEMQSIDFSVGIGASYDITEQLFVGARYNVGVSNVVKNAEDNYKANNSTFQIGLGYKFGK